MYGINCIFFSVSIIMINQKENKSKNKKGAKISNARVWAGWDKGIYLNSGGSPAKRAKAGGQKGRGFRSVMSPGIFARPPFLAKFLPRRRRGSRSISFKIGSDLVV